MRDLLFLQIETPPPKQKRPPKGWPFPKLLKFQSISSTPTRPLSTPQSPASKSPVSRGAARPDSSSPPPAPPALPYPPALLPPVPCDASLLPQVRSREQALPPRAAPCAKQSSPLSPDIPALPASRSLPQARSKHRPVPSLFPAPKIPNRAVHRRFPQRQSPAHYSPQLAAPGRIPLPHGTRLAPQTRSLPRSEHHSLPQPALPAKTARPPQRSVAPKAPAHPRLPPAATLSSLPIPMVRPSRSPSSRAPRLPRSALPAQSPSHSHPSEQPFPRRVHSLP